MLLLSMLSLLALGHALQYHPLLPREWTGFTVTGNQTLQGYFITSNYPGDKTCSGPEPMVASAFALGSCIVGSGASTASQYLLKGITTVDGQRTMAYTINGFLNTDCSGKPSFSVDKATVLGVCLIDPNDWDAFTVTYVEPGAPSPWQGVNKGVVVQNHYTSSVCSGVDSWTALSFNFCIPAVDAQGNPENRRYSACGNGQMTVETYTDFHCTERLTSKTVPLEACLHDSAKAVYQTSICNA